MDTGFEGPEKKLEVDFILEEGDTIGLRAIGKEEWQEMLDLVKCTILSQTSNNEFDSFVLSESSLFIFPGKVIIKTCGTTSLLHCIPKLLQYSERCKAIVDFVFFSRKAFLFPSKQPFPHVSFDSEVDYLNQFFVEGKGFILGPEGGDQWHLYLADFGHLDPEDENDQTLEIMMYDLDRETMGKFYLDSAINPGFVSAKQSTQDMGIADLIPGSISDEFQFEPCGYSVNGLKDQTYYTIHITPEPNCSFVSYETNLPLRNYSKFVERVVDIFKPGRWTVTLFADSHSLPGVSKTAIEGEGKYNDMMESRIYYDFEGYNVTVCDYKRPKNFDILKGKGKSDTNLLSTLRKNNLFQVNRVLTPPRVNSSPNLFVKAVS